jgi:hypothetical protein
MSQPFLLAGRNLEPDILSDMLVNEQIFLLDYSNTVRSTSRVHSATTDRFRILRGRRVDDLRASLVVTPDVT